MSFSIVTAIGMVSLHSDKTLIKADISQIKMLKLKY